MSEIKQYIDTVRQCAQQCHQMLALEHEKRSALLQNEGPEIQRVLKKQQAALMQLEALEKKRLQAQTQMGISAQATAQQVLDQLPEGEEKRQLLEVVEQLTANAQELRSQNKDNLELARLDLQVIESAKSQQGLRPSDAGVYRPTQSMTGHKRFDGSF